MGTRTTVSRRKGGFRLVLESATGNSTLRRCRVSRQTVSFTAISRGGNSACLSILVAGPRGVRGVHIFTLHPSTGTNGPRHLIMSVPVVNTGGDCCGSMSGTRGQGTTGTTGRRVASSAPTTPTPPVGSIPISTRTERTLGKGVVYLSPNRNNASMNTVNRLGGGRVCRGSVALPVTLGLHSLLASTNTGIIVAHAASESICNPCTSSATRLRTHYSVTGRTRTRIFISVRVSSVSGPRVSNIATCCCMKDSGSLLLTRVLRRTALGDLSVPSQNIETGGFCIATRAAVPSILVRVKCVSGRRHLGVLASG